MKHCSKCFEVLPMNKNFFDKTKDNKSGLRAVCKGCRKDQRVENKKYMKDYRKKYRSKNKDILRRKSAEYYARNKERIQSYKKIYQLENKESIKLKKSHYYKRNKDYINEKNKEYYRKNKNKIYVSNNKWRKENPDKYKLITMNATQRRLSKKRSLISTFTLKQWQHCLTHFNHSCAYCGGVENLEQEHVIPVSKGGHYTVDNIIPACRSCNASKNNKEFEEWYTNHESYSEERIIKIKEYLEHYLKTAN